MECRICSDAMTALLDDELSSSEANSVKDHLHSCSTCQQEFQSLSFAYQLTGQLGELEVAPDLWDRITPRLPSRSFFGQFWSLFRRPWVQATVGALVLAAFLSVFLWVPGQDQAEKEFAEFIQQRERISAETQSLLFSNAGVEVNRARSNPFVKPVSFSTRNPFQE
ncbi:MAG: zf-HC2 domain-containing protein [Acidobacteriota bacterium]|nr:MAG: zf-HC2 domain-containing protein [Acidobacteriota bacterium]